MPLCNICNKIDFSIFISGLRQSREQPKFMQEYPLIQTFPSSCELFSLDVETPVADSFIAHHRDIQYLAVTAEACGLCGLIEQCVNATAAQFPVAREQGIDSYSLSGCSILLAPMRARDGFGVIGQVNDGLVKYMILGGIGLRVDEGMLHRPFPLKSHMHCSLSTLLLASSNINQAILLQIECLGAHFRLHPSPRPLWGKSRNGSMNVSKSIHIRPPASPASLQECWIFEVLEQRWRSALLMEWPDITRHSVTVGVRFSRYLSTGTTSTSS